MMLVSIDLACCLQRLQKPSNDNGDLLPSFVWKNLPYNILFDEVLVHLSFPCLLKLRSVSRYWQKRLSSSQFWQSWLACNPLNENCKKPLQELCLEKCNSSVPPSLLTLTHHALFKLILNDDDKHIATDDPSMMPIVAKARQPVFNFIASRPQGFQTVVSDVCPKSSCLKPLLLLCTAEPVDTSCNQQRVIEFVSSVPCKAEEYAWIPLRFKAVQDSQAIMDSDAGLVLLVNREKAQCMMVWNPLLGVYRVLPSPLWGPFVENRFHGFKVEDGGKFFVIVGFQVYDSVANIWQFRPKIKCPSPSVKEGCIYWLSSQAGNEEEEGQKQQNQEKHVLWVYDKLKQLFTFTDTTFPVGSCLCGHVWNHLESFYTLAETRTWFGTWRLHKDKQWKQEQNIMMSPLPRWNLSVLNVIKIDSVLFMSSTELNQVFAFNLNLNRGAWTRVCSNTKCLTGFCVCRLSSIDL